MDFGGKWRNEKNYFKTVSKKDIMRSKNILLAVLASAVLAGCATPQSQMKREAGEIEVSCDPEVLIVKDDKIDANITLSFPEGYFDENTMMVITPVLVYGEGQQRTGKPFIYQGEKIMANYKVVPRKGIFHHEALSFDFIPGMEKCRLELRCTLIYGTKKVTLKPIKVADGCNATYRLVQVSGEYAYKPDGYERVTNYSTETSILFDVNSSTVKNNTHNRNAVSVYKSYLSDIKADERYEITGTEIVSYASPEGGEKYNAQLSDKRASSAVDAWKNMSGGASADTMSVRSIGQDWEGFKQALEDSDIEEKDLILRVLSMYSDPAVREAEMKNLSFLYDELKTEVFPSLRRATFVVNAQRTGYSDEELIELADKHLSTLSEPEVLHLASIVEDRGLKKFYYRYASQRYLSQTGYFNLAMMALDENKTDVALTYLDLMDEDSDVLNARGVVELRKGHYDKARTLFLRAATPDAKKNLGTLLILSGQYDEAAEQLSGTGSSNEVLAYILSGQIDKAVAHADCSSPRDAYIAAIAYARNGDAAAVKKALAQAGVDPVYAEKSEKDVEFVNYR